MRIRDCIQLGKNVVERTVIKVPLPDGSHSEISWKGIFDIHENTALIQNLVSAGFCEQRLLWQDWAHELKFAPQEKHREILTESLKQLNTTLTDSIKKMDGFSGEEIMLLDWARFLSMKINLALKEIDETPSWKEHNNMREFGSDDERMTPEEETINLLGVIYILRKDTYPIWINLIDFLKKGPTQDDANQKLNQGCRSIGLLFSDVEPNWEPTN